MEAELLLQHDYCLTLEQLAQASGLSVDELHELTELGALSVRAGDGGWLFASDCLAQARVARRLREDFELSLAGVALVLAYRERISDLEQRLRALACELPGRH